MHASRPPVRRQRLLALSVGVLVLGGQLTSLAHVALVKHVVCAAHGDLMHADRLEPQKPAAVARERTTVGTRAEREGHGDQHCLLTAVRRDKANVPAVPRAPSPVTPPEAVAVTRLRASAPSLELLDVAPKLSPPA